MLAWGPGGGDFHFEPKMSEVRALKPETCGEHIHTPCSKWRLFVAKILLHPYVKTANKGKLRLKMENYILVCLSPCLVCS